MIRNPLRMLAALMLCGRRAGKMAAHRAAIAELLVKPGSARELTQLAYHDATESNPQYLIQLAAKSRRARQTHRHKRGKNR